MLPAGRGDDKQVWGLHARAVLHCCSCLRYAALLLFAALLLHVALLQRCLQLCWLPLLLLDVWMTETASNHTLNHQLSTLAVQGFILGF